MVTNTFLLHLNMSQPKLIEEIKRHAFIVSFAKEQSGLEKTAFLKLVWLFMFKVKSKLKTSKFVVTTYS